MPEIDVEDVQSKIAKIFEQVFAAYGHQIFEEQAAKAIVGLSLAIHRTRGPERLEAILMQVPMAVENALAGQLKRFQVIPTDDADPIRRGSAMISNSDDLQRVVGPHLGGGTMQGIEISDSCHLYVDDLAIPKELPRNERATAIYRSRYLARHPSFDPEALPFIAGPAVLFGESVGCTLG
jgi:hypothetical protein